MSIKRITAATETAVSLAEFQTHAKIDGDLPDTGQHKLVAAEQHIEMDVLGDRALITSTWEVSLESWPCDPYINLPKGNLQSVAWVRYTDSAGTIQTLSTSQYKLVRTYTPADAAAIPPVEGDGPNDLGIGRVWLRYNKVWPTTMLETGEPITIRFTAGWKDAESVPTQIKQAIELMGAHLYRNREATTTDIRIDSKPLAMAVESLCAKYVLRRF